MAIRGRKFTITPTRRSVIIPLLEKQHTISTIATLYGVNYKTMSKALKRAGIDPNDYRKVGIANLKARVFDRLEKIDDHKDYANTAIKVLDRYDPDLNIKESDSCVSDDTGSSSSSDEDIKKKILIELEG